MLRENRSGHIGDALHARCPIYVNAITRPKNRVQLSWFVAGGPLEGYCRRKLDVCIPFVDRERQLARERRWNRKCKLAFASIAPDFHRDLEFQDRVPGRAKAQTHAVSVAH